MSDIGNQSGKSSQAEQRCLSSEDISAWHAATRRPQQAEDTGRPAHERLGVNIKSLYTAADQAGLQHADTLPGFAPFLRGPQATMYTGKPWTIRQYGGFATAAESNAFYRKSLKDGAQGVSVAFDLPTQRGYDSDHPHAVGDVGKVGVAIDSVEDMKALFDGIPLGKTSVSMTMNGAVLPVLACFIVAAEEQGVAPADLTGTIQNDILKEFIVRNTYIYPPAHSMRIVGDVIEYATHHMPRFNPISISGYHMQEAGASPVLELAFTIADGKEYVKTALARGLDIDAFAKRLSFFWCIGMDFYVEIAKLRAARLLWWKTMQAFYPSDPRSAVLRAHCQTSGWTLSQQDPFNNIVRTTIEAMAAVFGGTQSLHTNAFDEAISIPSTLSARIARNTQLILQEETSLTETIDPWGGSYFMESLTAEVAESAWNIVADIDGMGGMTRAVESGWARQQIERSAAAKQASIDAGKTTIVGVNKYAVDHETEPTVLNVDTRKVLQAQIQSLSHIKASRNPDAVQNALHALERCAAEGNDNLLELSVVAARARATVGEISSALEKSMGRYQATTQVVGGVYGAEYADEAHWERLRQAVEAFAERAGRAPRVLIAKLGQDGHDRGARIVATSFADLGFAVDIGPLFQTPEACARQAIENDVHAIGISSLSGGHITLVPRLLEELQRQGGSGICVFVGGVVPQRDRDALIESGVIAVFGPGTPIPAAAEQLLAGIEQFQGEFSR
ncbi:methylmalonyl-CoA mutase [Paraburkholderia sp. NMBU_R16]|uniref:methylmalonyl-CoA mutase n=1 Tax=Paraburkholderia sp. NMBU_R16 TaxID=2698676 RepID=UPI00156332E4|nr:methylmalonyl-CoA mutase [Paraburkholderia sp. NMBU_R16]NRO99003.1 methylmalonyl-CoA mutase [Paraburkholderia sp. NMBU_R16]